MISLRKWSGCTAQLRFSEGTLLAVHFFLLLSPVEHETARRSNTVVPKFLSMMSYYPQNFFLHFRSKISFAVITRIIQTNIVILVLRYPPEESHITPDGVIYPQLRNHFPHCIYFISGCAAFSSWSLQVWSQLYTEFFQMTGMTNTLMERLKPAASNSASTRTCSRWTRISSIKLSPLRWESCVKMNKNLKTNDFNETVV